MAKLSLSERIQNYLKAKGAIIVESKKTRNYICFLYVTRQGGNVYYFVGRKGSVRVVTDKPNVTSSISITESARRAVESWEKGENHAKSNAC